MIQQAMQAFFFFLSQVQHHIIMSVDFWGEEMSPTASRNASKSDTRRGIIESIITPLGFFVLSLLIIETFLGTAMALGDRDRLTLVWIGVFLFCFDFVCVYLLAWFKLEHLTFSAREHIIVRNIETPPPQGNKKIKRKAHEPLPPNEGERNETDQVGQR